jgi:hypothetical protein
MKSPVLTALFILPLLAAPVVAQQGKPGAHFIENWDLDGNGSVTLEEATQKRSEIHDMFDQDESGALDSAEYDLFDETRQADIAENAGGHGGPMRGVDKAMMREVNDVNADGAVTKEEFLSGVPAWFDKMDRDGDDRITTSDFGRGKG